MGGMHLVGYFGFFLFFGLGSFTPVHILIIGSWHSWGNVQHNVGSIQVSPFHWGLTLMYFINKTFYELGDSECVNNVVKSYDKTGFKSEEPPIYVTQTVHLNISSQKLITSACMNQKRWFTQASISVLVLLTL